MKFLKRDSDILLRSFNAMWSVFFVSQLVFQLATLINGFLVGHYLTPAAIAATGLFAPCIRIYTALSSLVTGGYRVKCGHCMGAGKTDKIFTYFLTAAAFLFTGGLILTVCYTCFPVPIARLLGATEETLAETVGYVRGMGMSSIPYLLLPFFLTASQMNNRPNFVRIGVAVQAVGNLVFGYVAVRYLDGGLFGIGAATGLSMLCAVVFMGIGLRFPTRGKEPPSVSYLSEMIKIGLPDATLWIVTSFVNFTFNFFARKYGGTAALAAVAMSYLFVPIDALCSALANTVGSLASVAVGERNNGDIRKIVRHALRFGFPIIFALSVLVYVVIRPYASFFGAEGEILEYVSLLTLFSVPSWLGYAFALLCVSVYQAMEENKVSVLIIAVEQLGRAITVVVMTVLFGLTGLWAVDTVAKIFVLGIAWGISWYKMKRFPRGAVHLFDWADKFNSERAAYLEASSLAEAVGISEKILQFLRESPAVKKNALKAALCAEETAVNIFEFAAGKELKAPLKITVFVSVCEERIFMKVKDNAPAFDPTEILKIHTEDENDPAKNSGIRLVSLIAQEMNYQNIFGLNALSIRL